MLSTATDAKLKLWVGADTWHTGHPFDMQRFYDFVDQFERDYGTAITNESELEDHIAYTAGCFHNDALRAVIRRRVSLAGEILDFLARTGR